MEILHLSQILSINSAVPIFGYILPPLAVFVLILNVLLVLTLSRRHMRSPINSLLMGIVTMDTLAIMMPIPIFINFFTIGNYQYAVPYSWCQAYFVLMYVAPLTCNMASIWTTVTLASVRCYSIWRPLSARTYMTSFKMNVGLAIIVVISVATYCPNYFEYSFTPITNDNVTMACKAEKSFSRVNESLGSLLSWIQIVMTSHIPWVSIIFPDVGMLWQLKKSERNRNAMFHELKSEPHHGDKPDVDGNTKHDSQARMLQKRHRKITWMVFINVTLIWLVEIPFATVFTKILLQSSFDFIQVNIGTPAVIVMLVKYMSYPVIFFTNTFMCGRFRKTFKDVVLCRASDTGMSSTSTKTSSGHSNSRQRRRNISSTSSYKGTQ